MARATPKGGRARRRRIAAALDVSAPLSVVATVREDAVDPAIPMAPPMPSGPWRSADAAVVGSAHLRASPVKPCQDAALADVANRPLLVLADGAGSAPVSHIGAAAVIAGIRRLCRTLEGDLAVTLDDDAEATNLGQSLAGRIVVHARGLLEDLAAAHVRDPGDFRCTLLTWVVGRKRALWLKVGDGALVAEVDGECHCVGPVGKGEFANQTNFIGPRLEDSQWACGTIDATRLAGLAAMSDGAAERLIAQDASRVSPAIGKLLRGVAGGHVGRREVFSLLAEADLWKGTSGDDKSLALIARQPSQMPR